MLVPAKWPQSGEEIWWVWQAPIQAIQQILPRYISTLSRSTYLHTVVELHSPAHDGE